MRIATAVWTLLAVGVPVLQVAGEDLVITAARSRKLLCQRQAKDNPLDCPSGGQGTGEYLSGVG